MHRSLIVVLLSLLGWVAPLNGAAPAMTQVSLKLSHTQAKPGETVTAALQLKHSPEWHTYWQNPGGVGKATKITWTLPDEITAGEIQWPVPEATVLGEVNAYSYDGEIGLLIPLTIAPNASAGTKSVQAKASWLECKTDGACVPQTATFDLALTVASESKTSADAEQIEAWRKLIPQPASDVVFSAHWDAPAATDVRPFVVVVEKPAGEAKWDFYAFKMEGVEVSAKIERLPPIDGKTAFRKFAEKFEGDWPVKMEGLAALGEGKKHERAAVVSVSFGEGSSASPVAAVGATGKVADAKEERSLLYYLLFAFVGGLILNIMPCVLPVISLKILGFVRQSKEDPRVVRRLGVMYAVGVLVSFVAMAAMVIAIKQAGKAASWGMQFQNPVFLVFITTLVTLVALNLFGVFEVAVGGNALSKAGELASREGNSGAFFNGVLATLLATPCTAPFLAPALGFAFVQPAGVVLLMFVVIGLGLAFPYVVLCWFPAWLKKLPKPGAWMEKFKIAMGFPMVATALWLFSVAFKHLGDEGAITLALYIAMIALAAWIYGEFAQRGSRRVGLAKFFSAALVAGSVVLVIGRAESADLAIKWQPWNEAAVKAARAEGHPVLVDFTADWCFTCKVNKRTSIEIDSVRKKLRDLNVAAFKADFTREDPVIAAELAKFQRAGVPLVLVFPADASAPPQVLPAFLTESIVVEALEKAAGSKGAVASK